MPSARTTSEANNESTPMAHNDLPTIQHPPEQHTTTLTQAKQKAGIDDESDDDDGVGQNAEPNENTLDDGSDFGKG